MASKKKKPVISLDTKLKKGDQVKIIAGKHKGHVGPIIQVMRVKNRVIIEGITAIKHKKPSQEDQEGGIVEVKASVHISNVMVIDGKLKNKKTTKIGYKFINDKKVRIARSSATVLGQ